MTRGFGVLILVASVTLSSLGHFLLKIGASKIRWIVGNPFATNIGSVLGSPTLWAGVCFHGGALVLWVFALARMDLGYAYPFLALGYVLVFLLSILVLGEPWSAARVGWMALIIAGVVLIART